MSTVSIIIPTFNAGRLLKDVLDSVFNQTVTPDEVVIIDSSSSDGTDVLAKSFPVRYYSIDKRDFAHGTTRNYGVSLAKGDYVVFLTQDSVPRNQYWLFYLLTSLESEDVAGSFSRQIARDTAVPMEKFFYSHMYPEDSRTITKRDNLSRHIVFSNASSALRRSVALDHPFAEDILMSEDLAWALDVLSENYKIAYAAESMVTHSHDYSIKMIFKRYFDFGVSHSEISWENVSENAYYSRGLAMLCSELGYLVRSGQSSWIPTAMAYDMAKACGLFLGQHNQSVPRCVRRHLTSYYSDYWR